MYKAIVFDVDGTVVDTRFILDACRDAYFDVRGEKLSEEICDIMYGSPAAAAQGLMGLSDEEFAIYGKQFAAYLPLYLPKQKLFDGIRECMEQCRKLGLIVAINTSRTVAGAEEAAASLEWNFAEFCDHVIGCDLVENPKPAPDSLLYLAKLCGLSADEILFVGDTEFDSGCAANAGVDFAVATWGCKIHLPATYYPKHPLELLDIIKQKNQ